MPEDDPRHPHVLELTRADLAGVRARPGEAAILCGDFDVGSEGAEALGDVDEGRADDDLGVRGDGTGGVEFGDERPQGREGAVGLPMAAEELGSGALNGWGSLR